MRVLVLCEESQAITKIAREHGHEAYSCDIKECTGGHPEWHFQEDAFRVIEENPNWDLVIGHPPCFVADTKVITFDGVKSIQDVKVGDLVLTHKGRYKKVLKVMNKLADKIATVQTENCGYIKCTPNHPFYTSLVMRNNKRQRIPSDFEWTCPNNFISDRAGKSKKYGFKNKTYTISTFDNIKEIPKYEGAYIGQNAYKKVLKCEIDVTDVNFWYIVGRWLGDGWFYYQYHGHKRLAGIKICCSKLETEKLKESIKKAGFKYFLVHERTIDKFEISNKELGIFMQQFGEGALNKYIPGFVTRLPEDLAKAFLEGYFDADGSVSKEGVYSCTSISMNLIYGLKYMINKYYKVACSVSKDLNLRGKIIEGRTCNIHTQYCLTFRKDRRKQTKYLIKGDYILAPYRKVVIEDIKEIVYNLSVEEDESYTANGIVVHNCTDLAVSGARHYDTKREDGRQRESIEFFCKMLNLNVPRLCIENPINIISGDYVRQYFPDLCEKYGLPINPSQIIQPYEFGDTSRKTTCLWLRGLPLLEPTKIVKPDLVTYTCKDGRKVTFSRDYCQGVGDDRGTKRSKTYHGIALAMVNQWCDGVYPKVERKGLLRHVRT